MNTKKKFTPEERAEYRERQRGEAAEMLTTAARELLSSDGWKRWASTRARFHKYSMNNTFLIFVQCPEATHVTGYRQWLALDRHVLPGERAIRIFAPMLRWPNEEDLAAGASPDRKVVFGYKLVSVFDFSQTEGEPLPELPIEPLTGDSHEHYLAPLIKLAASIEYTVEYEELHGDMGGYCQANAKRIVLASGRPVNATVRTLIHELAHALGVGYKEYGREAAEVIVETAAFIVCTGIGLDTSGVSVPYVAAWGEDDELAAVEKFAGVVDNVARQIEKAITITQEVAA